MSTTLSGWQVTSCPHFTGALSPLLSHTGCSGGFSSLLVPRVVLGNVANCIQWFTPSSDQSSLGCTMPILGARNAILVSHFDAGGASMWALLQYCPRHISMVLD